jgi:hypothetical protein
MTRPVLARISASVSAIQWIFLLFQDRASTTLQEPRDSRPTGTSMDLASASY